MKVAKVVKINFAADIVDYAEIPIPISEKENMTLGFMAVNALNALTEEDKDMSAEDKMHRAVLSLEIFKAYKKKANGGIVEVDSDDVTLIKVLLGPIYTPLPLMRAYDMLDQKD